MKKLILPPGSVDRLMREVGVERIAEEAPQSLATILEKIAKEITKLAYDLSKHSGRKTIKARDIELAFEIYKKQI